MIGLAAGGAPAVAEVARIALTRVPDDHAGVGAAIKAALDDSAFDVVSGKRIDRMIAQLGLDGRLTAERDLGKLASELEVDAIVKAAFEHRAHRVRFRIFAKGKQGKPFVVAVRGAPESKQFRALVRDTLIEKLNAVLPAAARDDGGERAEKGEQDEKPERADKRKRAERTADAEADNRDEADQPARHRKPEVADDTAPAPADTTADQPARADHNDDDTADLHAVARPPSFADADRHANTDAVRIDVGASFTSRTLRFRSTALAMPPVPYKNAPVPGGRIAGELYPFAFGDPHTWLAGLGVAGDFDQVASLTLRASAEPTVGLKATERRYAVGVRYRIAFGASATSPTVTLGVGYGASSFTVARGALMNPGSLDLPDVDYQHVDPGVALRVPLGSRVALTAEARALLVRDAGALERPTAYGTTKITAGTATAGIEVILGARLALRVAAEATQLDLTFAGNGTLSNGRDGNPATIDVRGATDRYLGGAATLAVLY